MASIIKKMVIYDQGETEATVLKEATGIIKNRYYTTRAEAREDGYLRNADAQFEVEIKVRRLK